MLCFRPSTLRTTFCSLWVSYCQYNLKGGIRKPVDHHHHHQIFNLIPLISTWANLEHLLWLNHVMWLCWESCHGCFVVLFSTSRPWSPISGITLKYTHPTHPQHPHSPLHVTWCDWLDFVVSESVPAAEESWVTHAHMQRSGFTTLRTLDVCCGNALASQRPSFLLSAQKHKSPKATWYGSIFRRNPICLDWQLHCSPASLAAPVRIKSQRANVMSF